MTAPSVGRCPECGEPKMPHQLCGACGTYKGKTIIHIEDELA
jgi:large subunit ribosomal protein L32